MSGAGSQPAGRLEIHFYVALDPRLAHGFRYAAYGVRRPATRDAFDRVPPAATI
jgi:hypothetical protein